VRAPLSVWRRTGGVWRSERIWFNKTGMGVALDSDGQRIWIARDDPAAPASLGMVRDAGFWVAEVELSRAQAIAASHDSALVAVGSYQRNTVALLSEGLAAPRLRKC
jgi:hypothetical protein